MVPAKRFERPWIARLSVVLARVGGAGFKAGDRAVDCGSWGCRSEVRLDALTAAKGGKPPRISHVACIAHARRELFKVYGGCC
jgi:hypothetical protein